LKYTQTRVSWNPYTGTRTRTRVCVNLKYRIWKHLTGAYNAPDAEPLVGREWKLLPQTTTANADFRVYYSSLWTHRHSHVKHFMHRH